MVEHHKIWKRRCSFSIPEELSLGVIDSEPQNLSVLKKK